MLKSLFSYAAAGLFAAAAVFGPAGPAAAETLSDILERGKIVVGVKADYRPWGFRAEDGSLVGLEIDMAKNLAETLNVELEMVPVTGSNRMEFLNQGKIDLIIATMGDNTKRRKVVGMIEPNYYAGGTNVLAAKSADFSLWEDLRGKPVCGIQGAYYNRRVTQLYGIELVAFKGVPEATNALRQGSCVAFLYDNTWIQSQLAGDTAWADYEMPMPTEDPAVWALGVRHDDLNGPFGLLVKGKVADWHRTGWLMAKEKEWGIEGSPFLAVMHEALKTRVE